MIIYLLNCSFFLA